MEKILNEDERLRRAEEIYLRRSNRNISLSQDGEQKVKSYFGSKILLHLLVLFNIAVVIFCIQNKDFIFTDEFLSQCNEYNINISEEINQVIKNFLGASEGTESTINENSYTQSETTENDAQENGENVNEQTNTNTSDMSNEENVKNVESSSISEMDLDAQNLKQIYKFVNPLEGGIVSSFFGARESEYQNVTGYHKGIDIAAEKGAPIKAAMQGIVELVSSEGDYR